MQLIERMTKGDRTLEHHRYTDEFGILRDDLTIVVKEKTGKFVNYPIMPPIFTNDYDSNTDLRDATHQYTYSDYEKLLDNFKL